MSKIVCMLENSSSEINGIKFVPHANGQHLISEADVGEPNLSIFLSIPGYCVEGAEDGNESNKKDPEPTKEPEPAKESAKQRAARLKAEKEAADKTEADRLAAEEAERLAAKEAQRKADEEAAKQNNNGEGEENADAGDQDEVF